MGGFRARPFSLLSGSNVACVQTKRAKPKCLGIEASDDRLRECHEGGKRSVWYVATDLDRFAIELTACNGVRRIGYGMLE